ncbi:MAG TPA: PQQ-binding-like beta-propeller repeat protein, partial [Pirellulaceae bacterium]|nr:PQQ-binding-like beta-propeller repeat protein [Pirellulaceae bacterium]
ARLLAARVAGELKLLDKNGDGKLDEVEALARFGWSWNQYNQPAGGESAANARQRARAVFAQLDKNKSGKLEFAEAGNLLRDQFERIDAEDKSADGAQLAAARSGAHFTSLDKDGDGRISRPEARGTALDRKFGSYDARDPATNKGDELLSSEELTQGLLKSEPGRDGEIAAAELQDFYLKSNLQGDGELTANELAGTIGGYRNGMGDGPRGTPTVDGDRLYAEGGNGDVTCLEAATGKTIWHVNLKAGFGGGTPGWGYSESPLVVGDLLIVTPGGKQGTLLALNKHTGERVWQSGEETQGAHYSSPVLAEINGVKQIVQFARESVFGVALDSGKPLWRYSAPANGTANCCSPIVEDNHVFASSAYGTGGGLAKIIPAGSTMQAEEVYFEKKMACHHGGMVKVGDHLYSNAAGALICMEFKTGKIAWQARSSGKGSLCVADGMLYLLGEGHDLTLAEATPEAYRERGRLKLASHGKPAWAHPVVCGGRLYVRDQESLTAYDVRAQ